MAKTPPTRLGQDQNRDLQRVSVPKYAILAQKLRREIVRGRTGPGSRLLTELELAERHGVSRPTVRQALAILEREGYILRRRKSGTVVRSHPGQGPQSVARRGTVLMICSAEEAAHSEEEDFAFVNAIRLNEQAISKRGFNLQIVGVGLDPQMDRTRLQELAVRTDLDGIIAMGPLVEPYLPFLVHAPTVTTARFYPGSLPYVNGDAGFSCFQGIEHLLQEGHRDIALVCAPWLDSKAFAVFANAYRDAFRARGLPYERSLMYLAHDGEGLTQLAREVLTRSPPPTAVFAENWRVCEAIITAAQELQLRIPDDFSLVAQGENAIRVRSPVAITTVSVPTGRIVERVVDMLIALIDGTPPAETRVLVRGELVKRESVGPPRRAK